MLSYVLLHPLIVIIWAAAACLSSSLLSIKLMAAEVCPQWFYDSLHCQIDSDTVLAEMAEDSFTEVSFEA